MTFGTSTLDFSILPFTEGVNPPVTKPNPAFLTDITEQGMRDLLDRFYMGLYESPIKDIFPQDKEAMKIAGQHSADFFIQICGGPAYFNQNRGAPQMIGRHAPFAIDANAREVWLEFFKPILFELEKQNVTETSLKSFWGYLDIFSI